MIGILNAYHFDMTPGNYQEGYLPMIKDYLKKVFPNQSVKNYAVAQGEFPKEINECSGWIVTGSACSCYEELDWIKDLFDFINQCHAGKVKTLGICFGHQLIAQALGGKVEKSSKGWGIGVRSFDVISYKDFMQPTLPADRCSLLFSHQDQVVSLPPGAIVLGTDSFCENQMYSIDDHILCLQGHPEFTVSFAKQRFIDREHIIGKELVQKTLAFLSDPTHEDILAQWFHNFFKC